MQRRHLRVEDVRVIRVLGNACHGRLEVRLSEIASLLRSQDVVQGSQSVASERGVDTSERSLAELDHVFLHVRYVQGNEMTASA